MKAPREFKRWVAKMRKRMGRRNGVLPNYAWDNPKMERLMAKNKRLSPAPPLEGR